jgi:hypothetical protein
VRGFSSRKGELIIETDEGERIASREAQKAPLRDWHLELTAGQYRAPRDGRTTARIAACRLAVGRLPKKRLIELRSRIQEAMVDIQLPSLAV